MKNTILLIVLIGLSINMKAQTNFGVHAGLNYSTFSGIRKLTDTSPYLCGLHFGLFMNHRINRLIDIQPEINYAQKGYKWNIDYSDSPDADYIRHIRINFKYNFIEVPVLVKFFIGQNLSIIAGPQLELCLNRNIAVKEGIEIVNENANTGGRYPEYHRVAFSLTVGIGYDLNNGIMLSARYSNGLTPMDKDGIDRRVSRNFLFSVGYKIFRKTL